MGYKDFKEFKEKIHPYYGKGNFTKNGKLASKLIKIIDAKKLKDELGYLEHYCILCNETRCDICDYGIRIADIKNVLEMI